ncbi:MAG: hypothetical protein ACLQGV_14450 [Bryobacteraceae bacterium]
MSTSPIHSLSNSYIQSVLNSVLQNAGLTIDQANNSLASVGTTAVQTQDNNQLSPFAQVMSELQQLQQSNPTQYAQVTQQIATNLTAAAQTATTAGNTTAASQLTQLATDFTAASTSGQLPSISDLAQALSGHHHHHHHGGQSQPAADSTSGATASSSSTSSTTTSQTLSQLLAAFEGTATQNSALDPMSIILNTLSSAGIGSSASA